MARELQLQRRRHRTIWRSPWSSPVVGWVYRLATRKPLGFVGLVILVTIGLGAVFAPLVAPFPYDQTDFGARLEAPSAEHLLGTDNLGRDLLSRVLYGARISFGISFGAVIVSKSLATAIALASGYYGGWVDRIGQRFVDMLIAVPLLIVLITIAGIIGSGPLSLILIIGFAIAPRSSRVLRSVVISVREEAYVEAARSLGARDARIMLQHLLPNMAHMLIYSATVSLGTVILLVASLGFLGYGVPPPHPDLGAMLSGDGLTYMRVNPWMAVWPGLAITLGVFSFNVLGDAMRDVLDPRLRGQ